MTALPQRPTPPVPRTRVVQVITRCIAGAGGVAVRGALALDPERYDVVILTGEGGRLLEQAAASGVEGVVLRHLVPELDPRADRRAYDELLGHLGELRPDVVHTHSAKAGTLGRMAARKAGVPAIVHTFHGFPFHEFQSWPRRAAYVEVERRVGRYTDQFLAVGTAVASQAIRLRIAPPERIRATVSTVDANIPPTSSLRRAEARARLGLESGAEVVGTVGRLDHQKAPLDFVAAAGHVLASRPRARFVWIGDGPLRAEVAGAVERAGLVGRVLLAGERRDVPDLLPAFDVFAMSSRYEGLPCALVEAMTCGIPAVATAVNAVEDVLVPGRTGLLVPPAAPGLLGQAVAWMLDHPADAAAMAERGRALTGAAFEPAALGNELEATYARALAEPVRSGSSATARVVRGRQRAFTQAPVAMSNS